MTTTKDDLEKAYPELVAELRADAVAEERKRVAIHLDFGQRSGRDGGGLNRALKAIRDGEALTPELVAEYYDARDRQRMIELRQEDSDLVEAALANANSGGGQLSKDQALANEVERQQATMPGKSIL